MALGPVSAALPAELAVLDPDLAVLLAAELWLAPGLADLRAQETVLGQARAPQGLGLQGMDLRMQVWGHEQAEEHEQALGGEPVWERVQASPALVGEQALGGEHGQA